MPEQIGVFPLLEAAAAALKQSGRFQREIDGPTAAQLIRNAFDLWLASGQKIKGMTASLGEMPTVEITEQKATFRGNIRFQGGPLNGRQLPIAAAIVNSQPGKSGLILESLKAGPEGKQVELLALLRPLFGNKVPNAPKDVDINGMLRQGTGMALKELGVELTQADFPIKGNSLSASLTGKPIEQTVP